MDIYGRHISYLVSNDLQALLSLFQLKFHVGRSTNALWSTENQQNGHQCYV